MTVKYPNRNRCKMGIHSQGTYPPSLLAAEFSVIALLTIWILGLLRAPAALKKGHHILSVLRVSALLSHTCDARSGKRSFCNYRHIGLQRTFLPSWCRADRNNFRTRDVDGRDIGNDFLTVVSSTRVLPKLEAIIPMIISTSAGNNMAASEESMASEAFNWCLADWSNMANSRWQLCCIYSSYSEFMVTTCIIEDREADGLFNYMAM
ncbi:hypothetical protein RF11_05420 [Thelohanellus kitauei]|uniref:Uncharacterized protein n=1 Tax=Thelohanellus kitauei TaxID=669202 RepID=A0A0C2MDY1_THEKT|nr:hypothetical protein RF11_05420 [Thelohanellus kitauei]